MIKLNLARNCLRYIIKAYEIKEIFIPYYSCNSLWSAVKKEDCNIKFYHIGKDFLPTENFNKTDYILYINYFGLCNKNVESLSEIYPNMIIDNTQAFYSEHRGLANFNSLRKFFNVQNGAYLFIEKELDEEFETDKYLFTPVSMQNNYEQFVKNELTLNKEEIKYIYPQNEEFMTDFGFEHDKETRLKKFWEYDEIYKDYNLISLKPKGNEIPYCYPLCTQNKTVQEQLKSYSYPLLSLWGEIQKDFPEYEFLNNTVALPLV